MCLSILIARCVLPYGEQKVSINSLLYIKGMVELGPILIDCSALVQYLGMMRLTSVNHFS